MPEERNKDTKKVKGYDDGLQEKLPSIYKMLHYQNRVATENEDTLRPLGQLSRVPGGKFGMDL